MVGQTRSGVSSDMQSSRLQFLRKLRVGDTRRQLRTVAARGPYGPVSRGWCRCRCRRPVRPGRGGQVQRAGVVGDQQVRLERQGRELGQPGPAAEVEDRNGTEMAQPGRRPAGDRRPSRRRSGPAPNSRPRAVPIAAKCSGGQRFVGQRAPRLRTIRGRGTPRRTSRGPSPVSPRDRQVESRLGVHRPRTPGDPQDPVDGVHAQPGCVDEVGVEPPRPFAGIGHPDADSARVAAAISADRSNPCKSIVRSNRPRLSRARKPGHRAESQPVHPRARGRRRSTRRDRG